MLDKALFLTLNRLPFEELEEIVNNFSRENFDVEDIQTLDSWVAFYFKFGRFPGSQNLVILPQVDIPDFVQTSTEISPIDLYKKFNTGEIKALVSLQALAALNIYFGGDRVTSKKAINEWLKNQTYQALTKENDNIIMSFDDIGQLTYNLHDRLGKIKKSLVQEAVDSSEVLNEKLTDTKYSLEETPEMAL